jgi:hypothetical protein
LQGNSNIVSGKVCQYCQSKIKSSEDFISCPLCFSSYHKECWYENEGCAVYGCNYKINPENYDDIKTFSIKDLLIECEFLINKKKLSEAINICNSILNVEPENIDAKILYNRIITFINIKLQLLEQADTAFINKDYKSAEIYYKDSLNYLDDNECAVVNSKLAVIYESIPRLIRKKRINNLILTLILVAILLLTGYFVYYHYFLKEERELAEIEKNENISDIKNIENQISHYERFISRYTEGKNYERAKENIFQLSELLIINIIQNDWKSALTYLKKIDVETHPKTYNDLYKLIYDRAFQDLNFLYSRAKKLDSQKKYEDAKEELDKALTLTEYFQNSEFKTEKLNLNNSLNIINKKINYVRKINDIEKEINFKKEELKKFNLSNEPNAININAEIVEEKSSTLFVAKNLENNKLIAIRVKSGKYFRGQHIYVNCRSNGTITIYTDNQSELTLPLFIPIENIAENGPSFINKSDKESIIQRLTYLSEQRVKLDSILNIKL